MKTIWFKLHYGDDVVEALQTAAKTEPNLPNRTQVGEVETEMGKIHCEIGPYWYDRVPAVFLGYYRQAVAIEHEYAAEVARWMKQRLAEVQHHSAALLFLLK